MRHEGHSFVSIPDRKGRRIDQDDEGFVPAQIMCVVGLVKRVHTLFGRNAQVVYELQVGEEVEGVRQEVREVKGEVKGEINGEGEPHTS